MSTRPWLPTDLPPGQLGGWYFLRDATGTLTDGATLIKDASGNVSRWSDQSGNGKHLLQPTSGNQPVYGANGLSTGRPGLALNGYSSLRIPSGLGVSSNVVSAFVSGTADTTMDAYSRLVSFASAGNYDYDPTSAIPIITSAGGGAQIIYFRNGGNAYEAIPASNTPMLFEGYATSTSAAVVSIDARVGTASQSISPTSLDSLGFGCEAYSGGGGWLGEAAEFVWTLGVLSPADLANLEGYLAWNNGTQGALPAGHACEGAAPTITTGAASVSGALQVTEAPDAASLTGSVATPGALIAAELADTAALAGSAVVSGALAAAEAADAFGAAGAVVTMGALAAAEIPDVAGLIGSVAVGGTLSTTEPADTVSMSGAATVSGTLAATEPRDVLGLSSAEAVAGALAATEPSDAATFSGAVAVPGALDASEGRDGFAAAGTVVVTGALAAPEARDGAAFAGSVSVRAMLVLVEPVDRLALTGASAAILVPNPARTLASLTPRARTVAGRGRVRRLASLSARIRRLP